MISALCQAVEGRSLDEVRLRLRQRQFVCVCDRRILRQSVLQQQDYSSGAVSLMEFRMQPRTLASLGQTEFVAANHKRRRNSNPESRRSSLNLSSSPRLPNGSPRHHLPI